jgi:hypothetical protein
LPRSRISPAAATPNVAGSGANVLSTADSASSPIKLWPVDEAYPDVWRFNEWNREFQQFVANGNLPTLEMIRGLSHDHIGSFSQALGGVKPPELQQADNDYAVGLLVQTVANSPYASNTMIFIIMEDDSQDGRTMSIRIKPRPTLSVHM